MIGSLLQNASLLTNHRVFSRRLAQPLARAIGLIALMAVIGLAIGRASAAVAAEPAAAPSKGRSVAFLGVRLQNDNEALDPTSTAERARMVQIEDLFKSKLQGSGRFTFVPMTDEIKGKIAKGQFIGECHGCEVEFGRALGGNLIAWVTVQKVSNLIVNMNVYMADVATEKMTFLHSVDIRGNTDESWDRSMKFLIDNYLLAGQTQ